jgi:hypothetical protein
MVGSEMFDRIRYRNWILEDKIKKNLDRIFMQSQIAGLLHHPNQAGYIRVR